MAEENLSIIYLIINASLLVQFVMALLLLASVTSWVMIVQRGISTTIYRKLENFEDTFVWPRSNIYYEDLIKRVNDGEQIDGIESVFEAGFKEYRLVSTENTDSEMIIEAVDRSMRIAQGENEKLSVHLPFLASNSVSLYVDGQVPCKVYELFSRSCDGAAGDLATVAPGISEVHCHGDV